MIYHIRQTTSTNDEARNARYRHGDVVWAEWQSAGRGQRGHTWLCPEGLNITYSAILEPTFLPAPEQFLFTEVAALSIVDALRDYGIEARIKWTNDLYVGDRKCAGMLIEHDLRGANLARSIAGIGVNINQREFDPSLPNPTSMALAAGREFDREEVLRCCIDHLMARYAQLEAGDREGLQRDYRARMYRLGERHPFRLPDGTLFRAVVEGVRPTGELQLRHDDGTLHEYLFRQVEFLIEGRDPQPAGER